MNGFDYLDLGGGVNLGAAPHAIPSRQQVQLVNWYPYATSLKRRGGVRKLTVNGTWDNVVTSIHGYQSSPGVGEVVVSGYSIFGRFDSSLQKIVTLPQSFAIGGDARPWVFFRYKNFNYALRRNSGGMVRLSDVVARAGIAAPGTGPTLAEGAAGALPAGVYRGVVTFENQETGMPSNPSPVSNALTLGASKKINWSDIAVSTNGFVNRRRLWRTLENQTDVYFLSGTLNDNTTTTFTEDVVVSLLGDNVSFNNGIPPTLLEIGVIFQERLFATDGLDLWFSEFLFPESFGASNFLPVEPDDGHVIRGLHPIDERLIIGKTNKMHYLVGNSRASFAIDVLDEEHGCKSHYSMKSANGVLYWFGTGKAVYRNDGVTREISTPRIEPILKKIPDEWEEFVVGAIVPEKNWYLLSVPQNDFSISGFPSGINPAPNRVVLVYNYKDDTWTTYQHPDQAPMFLGTFFDSNLAGVQYASFYTPHLYKYLDETYDWELELGVPIVAPITFKADDFGAPGYQKALDQVWLRIPEQVAQNIQLEALVNGVVQANRTVSLNLSSVDKPYKLPTWGKPGVQLQLRLTYSGGPAITLNGIHFEAGLLQRRPGQPR